MLSGWFGMQTAPHHGMDEVSRSLVALSMASALALATPTPGASAQVGPNAPSPEQSVELGNWGSQEEDSDSVRRRSLRLRREGERRSLAELEARDAILTRRLRAYGVGLIAAVPAIVGGLWLAAQYSPVFCKDCESRSSSHSAAGSFGWVLVALGAGALFVGIVGVPTAGVRRHEVRTRIRVLKLSPIVWISPEESVGGVQLSLAW